LRESSRDAERASRTTRAAPSRSSKAQATAVGAVAARSDHDDIVDVTVVEGAVRRHDAVVTSNPTHVRRIADAIRSRLAIETV
jgi:hypothetical protein